MIRKYEKTTWRNIPSSNIKQSDLNSLSFSIDDRIISRYSEKIKPTNCKNCGAPLKTDECEYCGTQY